MSILEQHRLMKSIEHRFNFIIIMKQKTIFHKNYTNDDKFT